MSPYRCYLCRGKLVFSEEEKRIVHEGTLSIIGEDGHVQIPERIPCSEREEEE